jgi:hypothetical protein
MSKDMTCKDFQFEIGKTYKHVGSTIICRSGFHASRTLKGVLTHYPYENGNRFFKVSTPQIVAEMSDKVVCREITILEELSHKEVFFYLASGTTLDKITLVEKIMVKYKKDSEERQFLINTLIKKYEDEDDQYMLHHIRQVNKSIFYNL